MIRKRFIRLTLKYLVIFPAVLCVSNCKGTALVQCGQILQFRFSAATKNVFIGPKNDVETKNEMKRGQKMTETQNFYDDFLRFYIF